jgi:uncharacterized protein
VAKCQLAIKETLSTCDRPDPLGDIRRDRTGLQNPAVDSKHHCRSCLWRYYCAGGCAFLAVRFSKSAGGKSPYCRIFKALIPDVVRLEGLRLLKWGA